MRSVRKSRQLPLFGPGELIVDLFAGGGGASVGIEAAMGRAVDVAINHDQTALAVHCRNHPQTRHFVANIWDVKPLDATGGRPVHALWASPDCTHFSVAKGGKPRKKKIRSLAWAVVRWAAATKPRVIFMENVQEFQGWGPLDPLGQPIKARMGETFRRWKRDLERLGYVVEHRVLDASLYGAPTRRRRLFLVARSDGQPIAWPEPTHGPGRQKVHTAAECIDWSLPCPSIFERKRPLAEKTLWRIAQGIRRFVLENPTPFIVKVNHGKREARVTPIDEPLSTVTATQRGHALVTPTLIQTGYGERPGQRPRSLDLHQPLGTVVADGQKHALVSAFLAKHFGDPNRSDGGGGTVIGDELEKPIGTVTTRDHHSLAAVALPQTAKGDVAFVLGAVTKLIKKGRNYGVGTLLITQRPAAVAKEVLNQCGTLFCFRQVGAHDRKAIKDWIVSKDLDVATLVDELPSLPTGTCYCWSPEWLKTLTKVRIAKKRTFDSTATPTFGAKVGSGKLAEVDLDKFKATMGDAIAKAKANDPDEMRKRIAELERQVKAKVPGPAKAQAQAIVKETTPMFDPSLFAQLQTMLVDEFMSAMKETTDAVRGNMSLAIGNMKGKLHVYKSECMTKHGATGGLGGTPIRTVIKGTRPSALTEMADKVTRERAATATIHNGARRDTSNGDAGAAVTPPAKQRILNALAFLESIGLKSADRSQLAMLADQSPTSGNYGNYLGQLRTAGLIDYPGNGIVELTAQGRAIAIVDNVPTTSDELHDLLRRKIPPAKWKIVEALIGSYPDDMGRDELAQAAQQSPTSGNFGNYLGQLRTLGLIDYPKQGRIVAKSVLFLEGR